MTARTDRVRVAELFGPTIQGEGPNLGLRAAFVRLVDCNLDCAWCDTPHTWDWTGKLGHTYLRSEEHQVMTTNDVLDLLQPMTVNRVIVTGGEPLLRIGQAEVLIGALTDDGYSVEVETNGTIRPSDLLTALVARWNVSPKLSGAHTTLQSIYPDVLVFFRDLPTAGFKFVVCDDTDLAEVESLCDVTPLDRSKVWLMPEGRTTGEVVDHTRWLVEAAVARGFNATTRLHTLAWGNERGR